MKKKKKKKTFWNNEWSHSISRCFFACFKLKKKKKNWQDCTCLSPCQRALFSHVCLSLFFSHHQRHVGKLCMLRFAWIKDMWSLGKQTQHFIGWEFWEILMCSRTVCSTSKDSLFSTSFTGYPSTVTFYEVQLQQLLLHQRHNFQKWCRNSRLAGFWSGRYYPLEGGGINRACLEEQKPVSAAEEFFVFFWFIYLYSLSFLLSLFPNHHPWYSLITQWVSPKFPISSNRKIKASSDKMQKKKKKKKENTSEHSLWRLLCVSVHLFLSFDIFQGGCGMFVPLLWILRWAQILKNTLLQQPNEWMITEAQASRGGWMWF